MTEGKYLSVGAKVVIDGVDVTSYLSSFNITEVRNGIRTAIVNFRHDIINFINVKNGSILEVYKYYSFAPLTQYKKFYGIINNKEDTLDILTVHGVDPLWKATGETITKVYKETDSFAGDVANILIDLYSYAGLTATSSTIDSTSVTLPQITCDSAYISEKTSSIILALNWDEWYNPEDNYVHVTNPDLYPVYGTTLEVGDNVTIAPSYNENIHQTINEIELQGVYSESAYEETFTGDGSTRKFTLNRAPISTYILVDVDGTIKKGSVDGATTDYQYLINKEEGWIEFTSAEIPASSKTITVNYTSTQLTSVVVDDEESINDNTKRKLVISVTDAISVDDAIQRAKGLIEYSKNEFYNFTVNVVGILDLSTRYKVDYIDKISNKNLTGLFINKIVWKFPENYEEVSLGNKPLSIDNMFYNVEERVKKLERKRQEGQVLTINKTSEGKLAIEVDDLVVYKEVVESTITTKTAIILDVSQAKNGNGGDAWSNLDNIKVDDGSYATVTLNSETSHTVYCFVKYNYNGMVSGIEIEIEGKATSGATISKVQMIKNFVPVGDILSSSTSFGTSDTVISVGGENELFGLGWDFYDFAYGENNGIGFLFEITTTANSDVSIDYVKFKIHYKKILSSESIVSLGKSLTTTDYNNGTTTTATGLTYSTADDSFRLYKS